MMSKILSAAFVMALTASFAHAEQGPVCAKKTERIQEQIEYAKQHGDGHRLRGLHMALEKVSNYCSDEDELSQQQQEVAEKQQEVLDRQTDLKEAQRDNKVDKLAKLKRKLLEAESELAKESQRLNRLEAVQ